MPMSPSPIRFSIDGSVLEGGGQILRNSVALSSLLRKPITITKIRQGRSPPGLKNQHRVGVELAANICNAHVTGATNGSTTLEYDPSFIRPSCSAMADTVTAGSTTLLLQTALPILLFSTPAESVSKPVTPSSLLLCGGTNASQAPQIEYTQHVLVPFLKKHFGLDDALEVLMKKRGYYPKGGGEIHVLIPGRSEPLKPIRLVERGAPIRIGGLSHVGRLPAKVATQMVEGALQRLAEAGLNACSTTTHASADSAIPIEITSKRERDDVCLGAGSGIVLWAELEGGGMIGSSALGRKGVAAEKVGEMAADELIKGLEEGGCVDEYLQDQMIIFMALATGQSSVRTGPVSLHTKTAIWLAEQLTSAKFQVTEDASGLCTISCEGIAYTRPAVSH